MTDRRLELVDVLVAANAVVDAHYRKGRQRVKGADTMSDLRDALLAAGVRDETSDD